MELASGRMWAIRSLPVRNLLHPRAFVLGLTARPEGGKRGRRGRGGEASPGLAARTTRRPPGIGSGDDEASAVKGRTAAARGGGDIPALVSPARGAL